MVSKPRPRRASRREEIPEVIQIDSNCWRVRYPGGGAFECDRGGLAVIVRQLSTSQQQQQLLRSLTRGRDDRDPA